MTKYYKILFSGELVSMILTQGYSTVPSIVKQGLPRGSKLCHAYMPHYNTLELTFINDEEDSEPGTEPELITLVVEEGGMYDPYTI